ncbi:MAG: RNA-binding protein [Candidatus Berkelbacteria bacterium]|jgi:RNA recognition motif-containing protein
MDNVTDRDETPAEPNQKLFIGGLAWAATDEDLQTAFGAFGEVVSASVVKYPDTGRSKGFAFVEFATVEEATAAKEGMDGKEIAGRAIKVDFARPKKDRDAE